MFQVRLHGRGGQGAVTTAELLSVAAFNEGKHAQAFPSFGSERMGAPVMSFCRIDGKPTVSTSSTMTTARAAASAWPNAPADPSRCSPGQLKWG